MVIRGGGVKGLVEVKVRLHPRDMLQEVMASREVSILHKYFTSLKGGVSSPCIQIASHSILACLQVCLHVITSDCTTKIAHDRGSGHRRDDRNKSRAIGSGHISGLRGILRGGVMRRRHDPLG